jgi:hypothetical protein
VVQLVEPITATLWPGVITLPVMDPWSSNAVYFRQAGIPVSGISGIFYDLDDVRAHGRYEPVGFREFYEGVEFMFRLMKELAS